MNQPNHALHSPQGELTGAGIDIRCKCVCPHEENATTNNTIFIQEIGDPSEW